MSQLQWLHNKYKGHRLFVIGTGPSLSEMDKDLLNALSDEYTMATNHLLRWADLPFAPTFHGISEPEDIPNLTYYIHKEYPMEYRFAAHHEDINNRYWTWVRRSHDQAVIYNTGMEGLGGELGVLPSGAATPLTVGVQLGAWMGFDPIYLLGCDNTTSGHVYEEGKPRGNPHPNRSSESAQRCEADMASVGRSLIDCTPNGKLGITYKPLEEVLGV